MRRFVALLLQIDVVHDLADSLHVGVTNAEAIPQHLERAEIAVVLEPAGVVHVEWHCVRIPIRRRCEYERRVTIDEAAYEPCGCEPIDSWPRPRDPHTIAIGFRL